MRMIIVDDDVQIREGMRDGVDWKDIGIDSVDSFGNVQAAMIDIQHQRADIIITDIKMPEINGIDFLKIIRERDKNVKVILISGYAEFEYAKEGIRYDVCDYILKPIKVRELIHVVQNAIEEIQKNNKNNLEQEAALEMNKRKIIRDILMGEVLDRNIILENINRYFGINPGSYILCGIVYSNDLKSERVLVSIKEAGYENCLCYQLEDKSTVLLIPASNSTIYNVNLKFLVLQKLLDIHVENIGISEVHLIEEISVAYLEALKCLDMNFVKGENACTYQRREFEEKEILPCEWIQLRLREFMIKGEEYECYDWFRGFLSDIKEKYITNKGEIIQLISDNLIYMQGNMVSVRYDFSNTSRVKERLFAAESLVDMIDIWVAEYRKFFDLQRNRKDMDYPVDIQEALRFIYEHFKEKISAKMIADLVGKSENYFRVYFRDITGIPLKDFINSYRIDQAERMLKYSNLYVYEIAEQVGFQDYAYFTKIFKKLKGYAPTSIRNKNES